MSKNIASIPTPSAVFCYFFCSFSYIFLCLKNHGILNIAHIGANLDLLIQTPRPHPRPLPLSKRLMQNIISMAAVDGR